MKEDQKQVKKLLPVYDDDKPEMFFSGLLFATAKVAYITTMIILHLILHSAFQIYDFHIFKT